MPATVRVIDNTGSYGSTELVARNAMAAFNNWAPYLASSVGTIDIDVILVNTGVDRANGGPTSSVNIGVNGALTLLDGSAAYKLRTGLDGNGATADITIRVNADYTGYWINPLDGTASPSNKRDLVSALTHEIGHGLGMTSFRDAATSLLSVDHETTYDALITVDSRGPFFVGANAMAAYGGPVPLTIGNLAHVGNATGLGKELATDLMNGFVGANGTTPLSALDVALISDLGVPTNLANLLDGSAGGDTMNGGGGNDTMRGLDGNDVMDGGADNDDVNGNKGEDVVHGGTGNDWVRGGQGNDTVYGDDGDDPHVNGNLGDDIVFGGAGNDTVYGGQVADTLYGDAGNDLLSGDLGNDVLTGGAGADRFTIRAGGGQDRVTDFSLAEGDKVELATGTAYTLSVVAGSVVVDIGGGAQLTLTGVGGLSGDWLVFA